LPDENVVQFPDKQLLIFSGKLHVELLTACTHIFFIKELFEQVLADAFGQAAYADDDKIIEEITNTADKTVFFMYFPPFKID
jgi:hypothetical protein